MPSARKKRGREELATAEETQDSSAVNGSSPETDSKKRGREELAMVEETRDSSTVNGSSPETGSMWWCQELRCGKGAIGSTRRCVAHGHGRVSPAPQRSQFPCVWEPSPGGVIMEPSRSFLGSNEVAAVSGLLPHS
jgi:hypothetical protein